MGHVISDISMSLDGYIAGPHPTLDEPLGKRGEELYEWVTKLAEWRKAHGMEGGKTGTDNDVIKEPFENTGAVIMGRKMFSGGRGPWEKDPTADGWWGDTPPFHVPVFILTSHPRKAVIKKGGTSFTFVTEGIKNALDQAKKAAGEKNILIAGGADVIQQFIKSGILDEIQVHVVPIFLGGGTPLFHNLENITLTKMRVIDSPEVTHMKFSIKKK